MNETENTEATRAVHVAFKRVDEYHREGDLRLIQVGPTGTWMRAGTFDTDYGTVKFENGFWVVRFHDDEGFTGVAEQVSPAEVK